MGRPSAILVLLTVAVGIGVNTCQGQSSGTVTLRVEMPHKEKRKGLRVRAVQKPPGTVTKELDNGEFDYTTGIYTYTIERLQPGEYDFVVCDSLEYKPGRKTEIVRAGQVLAVDFLLEDQPKGDGKITGVLKDENGRLAEKDAFVFLHDIATGCRVSEVRTGDNGKYEFGGLTPPTTKYRDSIFEADEPIGVLGISGSNGNNADR